VSAPPACRTFALLAAGAAAFTVYGSLVPFAFTDRSWGAAVEAFPGAVRDRLVPDSRSDALANLLLGVPLGFALLGAVRADRPGRGKDVAVGLLLLPGCLLFAAAVEFAQLFTPERTCAGSDVVLQTLGAALGMAAWVVAGRRLTKEARQVARGGAAVRLLAVYLAVLAFVQLLPMDLTLSPADVYRKFRDGRVRPVPFSEFAGWDWERAATLVQVFALYLPAGLLAARLPGRFWRPANWPRVAGLAVLLGCGMEALQLVVKSRTTNATDVLIGAAGAVTGWVLVSSPPSLLGKGAGGLGSGSNPSPGPSPKRGGEEDKTGVLSLEAALILGQLWLAAVLVVGWQPFNFRGPPTPFDWVPGLPREGKSDLFALEELLTKLIAAAPFGVLAAAVGGVPGRGRIALAALLGAAAAAAVEVGQMFLPGRYPCVTDVALGGLGAAIGAWAGGILRLEARWATRPNPERA
jgi:VanZ family protein